MTQIQYGEHTLDFSALPPKSLEAMLKRGVAHFLGNEQAAKVTNWKAKFVADQGAEPGEDEVAAKKAELVANALKMLAEGTVGTATRGPAADPIESEMDRIARREINETLKKHGLKFTGKGDDRKATFVNGESFTMDELIERRLANPEHEARIRKAAEKAIRDAAKQADAAKSVGGKLDLSAIG